MLKVEIKPSQVCFNERSGEKDGKLWVRREQQGYLYLSGDYPELFVFGLEDGLPPYEAGFYEMSLRSIYIGQYKRVSFSSNILLIPLKDEIKGGLK